MADRNVFFSFFSKYFYNRVVIGPRIIAAEKSIATTGGHAIFTNGRKRDLVFDLGPEGGVVNGPYSGC